MPFHVQVTHDKGILCFRGINGNGEEVKVSKEEAEDIITPSGNIGQSLFNATTSFFEFYPEFWIVGALPAF